MSVVLSGCDPWSITLMGDHRLRFFQNRLLSKMFVSNTAVVANAYMSWHGLNHRYKKKNTFCWNLVKLWWNRITLSSSYYYPRGWKWRQANRQIGWKCADLIKLMKPEGTERGREISDSLICHLRAWMTQGLLTAHIKVLVNLRWAQSFVKVSGTAACINGNSGLREAHMVLL